MSHSIVRFLMPAAGLAQLADQSMLVALPLAAVLLLDATPGMVGMLVAAHAAAWLAVSLPAGALVDRADRRRLMIASQTVASIAYAAAWLAMEAGSVPGLIAAVFVGASGMVLFVLTTTAVLPGLLPRASLPTANARLELARGLAGMAAPAAIALLAEHGIVAMAGGLAALAALLAAATLTRLPQATAVPASRPALLEAIRSGARFVLAHHLLRPIALCAIFWNFAFFALTASFVPFALGDAGLSAASAATAQGFYGAGALLAALCGGWLVGRRPPNIVLLAGPGLSVAAGLLMLAAPLAGSHTIYGIAVELGVVPAAAGWFLVGFGPVLWLICQTTVRQLVTPGELIGRVGATIQTAIYGVRPLGALCGGAVAMAWGPQAAVVLASAAFAVSFAVSVGSPLRRLTVLPQMAE